MPSELRAGCDAWKTLRDRVGDEAPDLLVLNEMPFGRWIASSPSFDEPTWNEAVAAHEEGVARLEELGAPVVAASRARELDGKRVNEAFMWSSEHGAVGAHTKQYFPDEPGSLRGDRAQAAETSFFHVTGIFGLRAGHEVRIDLVKRNRRRR